MPKEKIPFHEQARALRDIDKELTDLLARRAVLVAGLRPSAPSQAKRKQWQELEKELWQMWEQEAQACRSDLRSWRRMFSLAQELTGQAEPESAGRAYVLAPKREAMKIDLRTPGCSLSARLWAVLAAQTGEPCSIGNVQRNDRLVELVKALNQAGTSLYWDDSGVHSRGASQSLFGEGVVFAGENRLNLLLLMGLCLGRAGAARFTGGAGLKFEDLAPLRSFFPQLGARMAFLHPGSSSVPFRLESSGVLPESVRLPKDMPPELAGELALALCLAAPSYENPLTLQWGAEQEEAIAPMAATAAHLLETCGLRLELQEGQMTAQPGALELPRNVHLPQDPFLAAAFLVLPLFTGGRAVLHGVWPGDLPRWKGAAAMLESAGLELQTEGGAVSSAPASGFRFHEVEVGRALDVLPLAFVLAAWQAVQSGKAARLRLPLVGEVEADACRELASRLGLEFRVDGDVYVLAKAGDAAPVVDAFVAPDGRWCVAAALASFARPGLELANPGEVGDLIPNFWRYFNALPDPGQVAARRRPEAQEEKDGKKRRRRIVPGQ